MLWSMFDELRGVWKCGQTLSGVLDKNYLFNETLNYGEKRRNYIVKIYSN